ncbi:MAG: hypothetical protein ACRC1K_02480, partial [Planctomycetia bacterium]
AVAALNTVPIEAVALGRRTLGENPELSDAERAAFVDPDPATWRELRFRMTKADGGGLDVHLLRPLDWIASTGAAVGRTVHLDLAELGAAGPAECLSIGPCPAIEPGAGNVVTGLFRHHSVSNLLDLYVEGDPTPTGVTANHPYWSADREAFIPAGDLQIGERLQRADGTTAAVLRRTPRPDEPVFNLEVHGEHVFRVGNCGILVHNQCPIDEILASNKIRRQEAAVGQTISEVHGDPSTWQYLNTVLEKARSKFADKGTYKAFDRYLDANQESFEIHYFLKKGNIREDIKVVTVDGFWDID